jgi:hypothetical protein
VVVARRQTRALGHDAELDLTRKPTLAFDVPTLAEQGIVLGDEVGRRLVGGVAGAEASHISHGVSALSPT